MVVLPTNNFLVNLPLQRFMSEKYDGVRGYWTGSGKQFFLKSGKIVHAPSYFTKEIPRKALDGEFWYVSWPLVFLLMQHRMGRCLFDTISRTVSTSTSTNWDLMKFMVFDAPLFSGNFEQRYDAMKKLTFPAHIVLVKQVKCEGKEHLKDFWEEVEQMKGEGLVLKNWSSKYTPNGRSKFMCCKLKV